MTKRVHSENYMAQVRKAMQSDANVIVMVQEDNTQEILNALNKQLMYGLEAVGQTATAYAKEICPVDTGRLRASITYMLDGSEYAAYIGTNVEYAGYVEYGTCKMAAQPYLRPAAKNHGSEYRRIIESALSK